MKVTIVSLTEGEGRGAEVVLEQFLRGWDNDEIELFVIAPENSKISRISHDLRINSRAIAMRDSIFSYFREIRKCIYDIPDCDLIHGWTARTFELAYYVARKQKAKYTCTLHDHPKAEFHRKRRHFLMKYFAQKMDALICVSNAVKKECSELGYKVPMTAIANGLIDTGVSECLDGIRVGFLGMYTPWKGFAIVKRLIHETSGENIEWLLYGNVCKEIEKDAVQLQKTFPSKVKLRGYQKREIIFNEINILLHASTAFDPFPTTVIEAAMKGIPAIASSIGGTPEIIVQNETGYLFDQNNPHKGLEFLRVLLHNPDLRKVMGKAARNRYEKEYTVDKMVSNYTALWRSVISGHNLST